MQNILAAIIAIFMWLTSLTTTIPNLKDVNTNDIDLKNFVTVSDVREVSYEELYDFYQEEAYPANSDDLVIKAPKDSTAIAYAKRFGIKCEELV